MSRSVQVGASVGYVALAFGFGFALLAGCSSENPVDALNQATGGSGGSGGTPGGTGGSQTPVGTSGSTMGGTSAAGTSSAGSTSGGSGGTAGGGNGGTAVGGSGGGNGGSAGTPTQGGTGGTPQPQPMCPETPMLEYQNFDGEDYTYANWWGNGTPSVTEDGQVDSCYSTSTETETFVQLGTTFPGYNACATFEDVTAVKFYAKATVAGTVTVQLDLPETTPTDQQAYLPLASCDKPSCKWQGLTAEVEVTTEWAEYSVAIEDFTGKFPLNEEKAVLRVFWQLTGEAGTTFGLSIDEVTFE